MNLDSKRYFKSWAKPGPMIDSSQSPVAEDETLDFLSGDYRIYQYKNGHRFSTDDVLVAWYATQSQARVSKAMDLGSGLGTVAMICAWRLPSSSWVTIEAQERSYLLAKKSVVLNQISERMDQRLGDFRDPGILNVDEKFDLITGTPPYFDLSAGITAEDPQKVECRFETRGAVEDYILRAEKHMDYGAGFYFIIPETHQERVLKTVQNSSLFVLKSRAIIFKEGDAPLLRLYALSRRSDYPEKFWTQLGGLGLDETALLIRDDKGLITKEYSIIKISFGFPP